MPRRPAIGLSDEPGSAEAFIRSYVEQQLAATEDVPVNVYWVNQKSAFQHLRATLPLEWLERFRRMPPEAVQSLFSMVAKYGNREELLALIDRRLADPVAYSGKDTEADKWARARRKFWQLNAFFYHAPSSDAAWEDLKTDPKTIFALEHRLECLHSHEDDDRPSITAEKVFQIMDSFVEVWPKVPLPSSWGSGDSEDDTAYRFIRDCIWKIAKDTPDRRIPVLDRMTANPRFADFRDVALTLRAEASRKMALQDFRAPHPSEMNRLLDDNEVASVEDLRAHIVEELGEVQKWLDGSETEPLDAFYSGGKRVGENTARNRIVERLQGRMTALRLSVVIERHMSGGNRCDITASATFEGTNRLLVVELKGQWNKELYTAASAQLDQRYAIHPHAAKQGVYLALWYGNGEKVAGHSDSTITTAAELKVRVISEMPEELRSRVDVVVLDLSRPPPAPKQPKAASAARSAKPARLIRNRKVRTSSRSFSASLRRGCAATPAKNRYPSIRSSTAPGTSERFWRYEDVLLPSARSPSRLPCRQGVGSRLLAPRTHPNLTRVRVHSGKFLRLQQSYQAQGGAGERGGSGPCMLLRGAIIASLDWFGQSPPRRTAKPLNWIGAPSLGKVQRNFRR